MTFCTVVEFEWSEGFDRQAFDRSMAAMAATSAAAQGRLVHITGADDSGGRVIEVWRSGADAQAFAQESAGAVAGSAMPQPSRVYGFEVTTYEIAPDGSP